MGPYEKEVKLIGLAANAVGEKERISLQPRHGLRRIFETDTRAAHYDNGEYVESMVLLTESNEVVDKE